MLSHSQKRVLSKMEVAAAVIDTGRPLVEETYLLEGDGPLLFKGYKELSKVSASFSTAYYPNTKTIARATAAEAAFETYIDYATQCIQPAKDFFEEKFDSVNKELSLVVSALKAARLFSPSKVHGMKPTTAAVDELKRSRF